MAQLDVRWKMAKAAGPCSVLDDRDPLLFLALAQLFGIDELVGKQGVIDDVHGAGAFVAGQDCTHRSRVSREVGVLNAEPQTLRRCRHLAGPARAAS